MKQECGSCVCVDGVLVRGTELESCGGASCMASLSDSLDALNMAQLRRKVWL